MCLDQVFPFPTLLGFPSPTSYGKLQSQLTICIGSLLPPPAQSQLPQYYRTKTQPAATWGLPPILLVMAETESQLHNPSQKALTCACWGTWEMEYHLEWVVSMVSRQKAQASLFCPKPWQLEHLSAATPGMDQIYIWGRFRKAIICLQKQMISSAPSSSCANWLITRPVICNQYYFLGIYFTGGKYLWPHLRKGTLS